MDWYRIHQSSDGLEEMGKGIMDVNELHPALFQGSSETFLHMGRYERLRYLVPRYEGVTSGRWKYCEQEGGELKVMKPVVIPTAGKRNVGQKRKRSPSSSEASECDTSIKEAYGPCEDGEDDDDEELPKVKDESTDEALVNQGTAPGPLQNMPVDDEDNDAEGTTVKVEPSDEAAIDQIATVDEQPHGPITAAVADLSLNNMVRSIDGKPGDQQLDTQSSVTPELESLATSAQELKVTLLNHISKWAKSASILKLDLMTPAGELVVAYTVPEIVTASKSILKHVSGYCERVAHTRAVQQQTLEDAKASGMPADTVRKHDELVNDYKESEKELREVTEELTRWVDELRES
jgi:hypothetical protein